MSSNIVLTQVTQRLIVDMPSRTVTVVLGGPVGPPGILPPGGDVGQVLTILTTDPYTYGWTTP